MASMSVFSKGDAVSSTAVIRSSLGESSRRLSEGSRSLGLTSRNLAKVAVSMLYMSRGEEIEMQKGDEHIKKNMGEKAYKKLLDDPELTLVKISYCQRSLSAFSESAATLSQILKKELEASKASVTDVQVDEVEEIEKRKDLINHDFLIIELQPGYPEAQKICIMAHKLGRGSGADAGSEAGIYVEFLKPTEAQIESGIEYDHKDVRLYKIECKTKPISLQTVIDALTKEGADYSVRDANCWDYARATTRWLLDECIERASSPSEKTRFQKEREDLAHNLRFNHIIDTAEKMKEWLKEKTRAVKGLLSSK